VRVDVLETNSQALTILPRTVAAAEREPCREDSEETVHAG